MKWRFVGIRVSQTWSYARLRFANIGVYEQYVPNSPCIHGTINGVQVCTVPHTGYHKMTFVPITMYHLHGHTHLNLIFLSETHKRYQLLKKSSILGNFWCKMVVVDVMIMMVIMVMMTMILIVCVQPSPNIVYTESTFYWKYQHGD